MIPCAYCGCYGVTAGIEVTASADTVDTAAAGEASIDTVAGI